MVPWLIATLWALACLVSGSYAVFQSSFDNLTQGSSLLLTWDGVQSGDYPLVIYGQMINKTGDHTANSVATNFTSFLSNNTWLWQNVPSPLPYFKTAIYQLKVRPQTWASNSSAPTFATSNYFSVSEQSASSNSGPAASGSSGGANSPASSGSASNTTLIIVVSTIFPGAVVVGVAGFAWGFLGRRSRKQSASEKMKEKAVQRSKISIF